MREVVQHRIPMLSQLVNGLSVCEILDSIRSYPAQMKDQFCRADNAQNTLDNNVFNDLIEVQFSHQPTKKALEIDTHKYFCDFVDKLFYEGSVSVTFGKGIYYFNL